MKENNLKNTYFLAYGAAIAAIYVALTMAFQPISFGPVQFRISEALCILPFFTPAAIPGLFVGCFLCQSVLRGSRTGYRIRKPGNPDRGSRLLCAPQE